MGLKNAHAVSFTTLHCLPLLLLQGQVEQQRLSIPTDVPCAVQQWNGLIAVNYAARAAGVPATTFWHTCSMLQMLQAGPGQ